MTTQILPLQLRERLAAVHARAAVSSGQRMVNGQITKGRMRMGRIRKGL